MTSPGPAPRSNPADGASGAGPGGSVLTRGHLRGTTVVAAGLALLGAAGYAFLTITARMVAPADYAALASLYLLIAVIGPGLFGAIDLETSRLVSSHQAQGLATGTVVRQIAALCALMLIGVLGVLAVLSPLLVNRVFNGHGWLLAGLFAAAAGFAILSLPRGTLAGRRQLFRSAGTIGAEGAARLFPTLALAAAGVAVATPYGFALGLGPLIAGVACLPWLRIGASGARLSWSTLATAIGWLVASSLLSLAMANLAPVVVKVLLPEDPGRAGTFAFAFVMARIPLFVFVSLQTILLPVLSRAAATRDIAGLRRGIRQALLVVAALGAVGVAGTAVAGRGLLRVFFGERHGVGTATLVLLACGTVVAMLVQVLQPALLAVSGHRLVAAGFLAGTVAFTASFLLPIQPVAAAVVAQLAGGGVTAVALAAALRAAVRRQADESVPEEVQP